MEFKNKKMLLTFLNSNCYELGRGSQGIAYYNMEDDNVFKIFYEFFDDEKVDEYEREQILAFSNIANDTFIWADDTISVNGNLVGYKSPYIKDESLYKQDPLNINLDKFTNALIKVKDDIKLISRNKVLTFDIMYNILYGNNISIIDHIDYSQSDMDYNILYHQNINNFALEIYYFLVNGYFDEFVNNYNDLKELYNSKQEDILIFLKLFRQHLSEYIGNHITTLKEAKKCLNRKDQILFYQRII